MLCNFHARQAGLVTLLVHLFLQSLAIAIDLTVNELHVPNPRRHDHDARDAHHDALPITHDEPPCRF